MTNKNPQELNLTMTYDCSITTLITDDTLPEGYTVADIKSVRDGKWGCFLLTFKDDTTHKITEESEGPDDYKWCDEFFVYDEDYNEVDEDIIEVK